MDHKLKVAKFFILNICFDSVLSDRFNQMCSSEGSTLATAEHLNTDS